MMKKVSLALGVLALGAFSFAFAKTYDVSITHPAKAGNQQLNVGEYRLKVEGTNAVFTDMKTSKTVTVPVKIEAGDKKFAVTSVDSTQEGSGERINSITLGGSSTKLEFAY
jgi:hypothetical protein